MRTNIIAIFLFLSFTLSATCISAQSISGTWQTISEEGVAKSEVKIWKEGNEFKGKVVEIYNEEARDNRCLECDEDDPRYKEKVLGMTIIEGLEKTEKNMWENGEILDPQNGNVYDCKMWINDKGNLMVRGFIGISLVGRTQEWKRLK